MIEDFNDLIECSCHQRKTFIIIVTIKIQRYKLYSIQQWNLIVKETIKYKFIT